MTLRKIFPMGIQSWDKPVVITPDDLADPWANLGQTAVQIWLPSRVVALLGEPFADEYPDVWKVLQTVLEITAICCAKKFAVNIIGYLKCLVTSSTL